ncbi:MAG: sigma-70 family RNA polymerase sigma factor, partial [Planctomycetota bacterium]
MQRDGSTIQLEDLLRNAAWVEALARRLLRGDAQLAVDVVQETWVAALENPPREAGAVRSWLRTTVRNLAHHRRRTEDRRSARELRAARPEAVADDALSRFERQQELGRLVLALDEPDRTAVLLRFFEELEYEEIGRRTGVTAGTARVRVHRAVGRLRARLDRNTEGQTRAWLAPLAAWAAPKPAAAAAAIGVGMKLGKSLTALGVVLALTLLGGFYFADSDRATNRHDRAGAEARTVEPTTARPETTRVGGGTADPLEEFEVEETPEASPFVTESDYSLQVRVLDPEGRPLETEVTIYARGVGRFRLGSLRTNADGRADGFIPQAGIVEAEAKREGSYLRRSVELTDATPRGELVLRFPTGATVYGDIYSRHGSMEKDVRGKWKVLGQTDLLVDVVAKGRAPDDELPFSRVDAAGRYRIEGVPAGTYYLRVPGKFHVETIEVPEQGEVRHDMRLPNGRIEGHVRDVHGGAPIHNVQVVVSLRGTADDRLALLKAAGLPRPSDRCAPDEEGRYSFTHLPVGEYALFANGGGWGVRYESAALPEERPQAIVDFELEKGSFIQLSVQDEEGNDLKNPRLSAQGMTWGFAGRVSGFKTGKWDFFATAPGHELQLRRQVLFEPGKATPLDFKLPREAKTTVEFQDADGKPIAGVRVAIPREGYDHQQVTSLLYRGAGLSLTTSDKTGSILVLGLVPGEYPLVAKKSGFALYRGTLRLAAGQPKQIVKLEPGDTQFLYRLRVTSVKEGSQAAQAGIA